MKKDLQAVVQAVLSNKNHNNAPAKPKATPRRKTNEEDVEGEDHHEVSPSSTPEPTGQTPRIVPYTVEPRKKEKKESRQAKKEPAKPHQGNFPPN